MSVSGGAGGLLQRHGALAREEHGDAPGVRRERLQPRVAGEVHAQVQLGVGQRQVGHARGANGHAPLAGVLEEHHARTGLQARQARAVARDLGTAAAQADGRTLPLYGSPPGPASEHAHQEFRGSLTCPYSVDVESPGCGTIVARTWMNLLLLLDEDFLPDGTARLTGRRAQHAREVLRAEPGETLRVGRLGGLTGTGEVLENTTACLHLRVTFTDPSAARAGVDLLLAIPRPKALKKVLPAVASLGVDRVVLSTPPAWRRATSTPRCSPPTSSGSCSSRGWSRPGTRASRRCSSASASAPSWRTSWTPVFGPKHFACSPTRPRASLCTATGVARRPGWCWPSGPDGGWVPFEAELLEAHGFHPFSLGPRILRVETAVPVLLGQVALLREV